MTFPNYHTNPKAYHTVKVGGQRIKAPLVEIDGIKLEFEWTAQKATGTSGPTWVYKGANAAGPHKLTFRDANGNGATAAECFDDLMLLFERFGPVAQGTAGGTPTAKTSPYTAGQAANADAGGKVPVNPQSAKTTDADGFPKSTGTSVGPKPPTLTVENAFLAIMKTTAISLKSFEVKLSPLKDSLDFILEVIPQKAPVPAGTGVAPAKAGDGWATAGVTDPGAGSAGKADKAAAQAGAAT